MKSLAALAKYTGCYDKWQQIRESFQLKWSNSDPLQDFNSIYNNEKDLNHMYHIIILISYFYPFYYVYEIVSLF
jgi:hypothetical protein